jgi:uncharacterized Tic20 family protein
MTNGPDGPQPPSGEQPGERPGEQPGQPPYGQQPPPPPPPPPAGPPGGAPGGPPPGYGQPQLPPGAAPQPPLRPEDEKLWAIGAQLGGLLIGFVAPLVVWLVYRERSAFLDRTAKEALNFQLTLLIGYVVSFALACFLIGFILLPIVWIVGIVFMIMGAIAVSKFEDYRYPVNIRFIK